MRDPVTCNVNGCIRAIRNDSCDIHGWRKATPKPRRQKLPSGKFRTGHGYVMVWTEPRFPGSRPYGKGWAMLEHHKVMGEVIGRKLYPAERVKHKDGDGMNNDIDNLQLWLGGKPADVQLAWARKIMTLYGGLFGSVEGG